MAGFKFGKVLKLNGSLDGGRRRERRFALPGKRHVAQRRFGCGPAVICGYMRNWEAGPRDFGMKGVGAGNGYIS